MWHWNIIYIKNSSLWRPVPYEAVGHQVEDNCTGMNMEGNEGLLNVLKLTTDEDKEDVRLDEDNEKDERTSAL